ncbi:hypothetical protein TWF281_003798 [Arthrobotrys megalospora]
MNNQAFARVEIFTEADRSKAFDAVDKIRELQIGEVSLPQLVAVGDQSCGKSSLLQSITGISFPVSIDLCTRFATQIVLRRTDTASDAAIVHGSIVPGPTSRRNAQVRTRLESFQYSCRESDFGPEQFKELITTAGNAMGLDPTAQDQAARIRFSEDMLKIELSACHHPHLTIVDVPGLFHNPTRYQTAEDKELIRNLIESYVTDRRTIIMAVMDGRNNLAIQEVFAMARAADPEGKRTVGVITKCDAVQQGEEASPLKHGWFVVRNLSTRENAAGATMSERQRLEDELFKKEPWTKIDRRRSGVVKLKAFLGRLLYRHIQGELPRLAEEINRIILDSRQQLSLLGEERIDAAKQRNYLMLLAKDYESQVTQYLNGQIGELLEKTNPLKIRTHVQNKNEEFAVAMKLKGHTRPFKTMDGRDDGSQYNLEDLDGEQPEVHYPQPRDIFDFIRETYDHSLGPELRPLINVDVVLVLFRNQAKNWRAVAKDHISSVVEIVKNFNTELFTRIIREETVRTRIMMRIANEMTASIAAADQLFKRLVEDEFKGILQTVDEDYLRELEKLKAARVGFRLMGDMIKKFIALKLGEDLPEEEDSLSPPDSEDDNADTAWSRWYKTATEAFTGRDAAVEDIHDILKAYYPIALRRFIATINLQVIERSLLGAGGPIRLFSTEYVLNLTEEELYSITREDVHIANTRKELQSRLDRATKALEAAHSI